MQIEFFKSQVGYFWNFYYFTTATGFWTKSLLVFSKQEDILWGNEGSKLCCYVHRQCAVCVRGEGDTKMGKILCCRNFHTSQIQVHDLVRVFLFPFPPEPLQNIKFPQYLACIFWEMFCWLPTSMKLPWTHIFSKKIGGGRSKWPELDPYFSSGKPSVRPALVFV